MSIAPDDDRLLDLLERWHAARDAGRELAPDELCPDDPALRAALASHIAAARALDPGRTTDHSEPNPPAADTPADSPAAPPGFEVLGELGAGAFGVVYRARQVRLNRLVALKLVLPDRSRSEHLVRFLVEAEAAAAVDHPNVVRVYESGHHAGRPYLALELVDGGTLKERLERDGRLAPGEAAALVQKAAAGVGAAHALGIVHRDLKPANILLTAGSEPKVADFGLARRAAGGDLTLSGALLGSPQYMAPEQAAAKAKFVGPPADVWALGVILYECLTGRPPFVADSPPVLLSQIQSADPASVRTLVGAVPRDLDTIIGKCLAKEPELRYPTAAELADDLGRFGRGEPIRARPAGPVERLARWARRKPAAAAAWGLSGLALAASLVAVTVFGLWRDAERARGRAEDANGRLAAEQRQAEEARREAERLRGVAEEASGKLERLEYGASLRIAQQEYQDNNVAAVRAILSRTPRHLRGWEWGYLSGISDGALLTLKIPGPKTAARASTARLSPDGRRVLTYGEDEMVRLWDARTGAESLAWSVTDRPSLEFSPDGARVLAAVGTSMRAWRTDTGAELPPVQLDGGRFAVGRLSPGGALAASGVLVGDKVTVVDTATGREKAALDVEGTLILGVSFSADGSRVAVATSDGAVGVYQLATGRRVAAVKGRKGVSQALALSPDGKRLVTTAEDADGPCRVWDVDAAAPVARLDGHSGMVLAAAFSPDGARVATGGLDRGVRVWDAATGRATAELKGHENAVLSVSFGADGTRLVTAGLDGTARVWDTSAAGAFCSLPPGPAPHAGPASFDGGGTRLVTPDGDGQVRVWDLEAGKESIALRGYPGRLSAAAFSPDGARVVAGGTEGVALVWDARTGGRLLTLGGLEPWLRAHESSPDGALRANTWNRDGAVRVEESGSGRELFRVPGEKGSFPTAHFSPDGKRLLTFANKAEVRVWDVPTGKPLQTLAAGAGDVRSAMWSPDGGRVMVQGGSAVTIWGAADGRKLVEFPVGGSAVAAFGPDGKRVVTAGWDGVRVWDATTGAELHRLPGGDPAAFYRAVALAPDGARVVVGQSDRVLIADAKTGKVLHTFDTVKGTWLSDVRLSPDGTRVAALFFEGVSRWRVWDVATGRELPVQARGLPVNSVEFSPDGSRIVSAEGDGAAQVWDARTGQLLVVLGARRNDPLSRGFVSARFSADGRRVVTAAMDGPVRVWDAQTGGALFAVGADARPTCATFSPDGTRLVVGCLDGTLRVWAGDGAAELGTLRGHSSIVTSVRYSPDGTRIVSAGIDGTVRLWDAQGGVEVLTLKVDKRGVMGASFSPDGRRLVVTTADGVVRVFDSARRGGPRP